MPENCSAKSLPVAARHRRRVGGQHGLEPVADLAEDAALVLREAHFAAPGGDELDVRQGRSAPPEAVAVMAFDLGDQFPAEAFLAGVGKRVPHQDTAVEGEPDRA